MGIRHAAFYKLFGRLVPPRLVFFAIVGGTGLLIHMFILVLTLRAGFTFPVSQALAVLTAMTTNFALNNQVTYRDRRLTGRRFLYGLFSFYLICQWVPWRAWVLPHSCTDRIGCGGSQD